MANRLSPAEAIPLLEAFWDLDGYFFKLRQGEYEPGGAERLRAVLKSIDVGEDTDLPRRLVSFTWMIPTFMEWQIERVEERGGNTEALKRDIEGLRNTLNELLGVP
jgi:hypothetical protein